MQYDDDAAMTGTQREALIYRMKSAWAALPEDKKADLRPLLENADGQLREFIRDGKPPLHGFHDILRMKGYLTDNWDGQFQRLEQYLRSERFSVKVGPGGQIMGTGKYQELDPRWELIAGTVWLENLLHKHPFPPGVPNPIPIPDSVTIALVGDFGTGNFGAANSPSTKISLLIPSLTPHFTIHLGDVYYAGTRSEESNNLLTFWPWGTLGSFALNSNHEMYSGGGPYFNRVVGGPVFNKLQSPFSFFALENSRWIIVGLDSAYNANVLKLYMDGSLGHNSQLSFLRELAKKGKKVIVLTHHNGIPESGLATDLTVSTLRIFDEIMNAFDGVAAPAYWYWGHVHAGVAYKPLKRYNDMLCRCVGHGALPWGLASELEASSNVQWFEKRSANDPEDNLRVLNGFVVLKLDGAALTETFYDENGGIAWMPQ